MEAELLASDTEDDPKTNVHTVSKPERNHDKSDNDEFYVDCKMDFGNIRVSTLYYPGRPQ